MCLPLEKIEVLLQSFGFKYGRPPDADFIFDVRCLANPYWQPELKLLSGLDRPVIQYLEAQPLAQALLQDLETFIKSWVPHFEADNRSQVMIAIGCTGGQHRSVYMVESLATRLRPHILKLKIAHLELKQRQLA